MAGPIYKLWQARFTEAWYQLSPDEQQQRMAQVEEALTQAGGKQVLACNSTWSNEQWIAFGVEEFPDIEAVHKYTQLLSEMNWFRYIFSTSTLGTSWEPE